MSPSRATTLTQALMLVLALGLAGAGLALKYRRYVAPADQTSAADRVLERITQVASAHGWQRASLRGDGRETFPWLAFTKSDCERPVIVAIVKTGGELDSLARKIYGADVTLFGLDDSDLGTHRLLEPIVRLARQLGGTSSGASAGPAPRLAIHPAPPHQATGTCAGPPLTTWRHGLRPILLSAAPPPAILK